MKPPQAPLARTPLRLTPGVTLLVLAWASGIAWRVELEMRGGWMSLSWVSYFHWAVPIGALAFLLWVLNVTRVCRPWFFAAALLTFAGVAYQAVHFACQLFFAAGPSGLLAVYYLGLRDLETGFDRLWMVPWIVPIFWALIPLTFCAICRVFGVGISLASAFSSAVLFTASWPVAIFVRGFFEQRGSPDLIHALKSGFVIPFLVVSLGLPLLPFPFFWQDKRRIPVGG